MSAPTSMNQPGQKPQTSIPSTQPPATTTSILPSTKSHHHPTSPQPKTPQAAKPASNIISSRIEKRKKKKPPTHRNKNPTSATTSASKFLIRIFINNRLGTKREILCPPSATIGAFKGVGAGQLGTRPEAILLKRQGERPFRDGLTLEEYEIGDGACLDFEVGTDG